MSVYDDLKRRVTAWRRAGEILTRQGGKGTDDQPKYVDAFHGKREPLDGTEYQTAAGIPKAKNPEDQAREDQLADAVREPGDTQF